MSGQHLDDDTLIAYLLDELPGPARREAASHAEACSACAGSLGRIHAALASWKGTELPEPPAGVLINLLEAQAARRDHRRSRPKATLWLPAAAALAVIFLGGFWLGHRSAAGPAAPRDAAPASFAGAPPPAPVLDFRTTPPMDIWLAGAPGMPSGAEAGREGVRDSL